jgi:UPF0755 protein
MEDVPARRADRWREDPERPSRLAFAVVLALLLVIAGIGVGAFAYYRWCGGAGGPREPVSVVVPEGATGGEVVQILADAGVIRCGGLVGRLLISGSDRADEILAGEHELVTNMAFDEALLALTTPPPAVPTVRFTIPEGYTLAQIAGAAEEKLGIPAGRFERALGEAAAPRFLSDRAPSLEGFLFPDTYQIPEGAGAELVVAEMLDRFADQAGDLGLADGARELGLTPYELVIVASMIEEEAKVDRDRARIAAVIYNRLEIGMTLGIDATLLYDDPTPDGRLSASDLEFGSPYNTRLNPGLPPTPISNPGRESLEAALRPADVPFLYYVLCGDDGHHRFSVDYGDFLVDKERCLG